MTIQEVLILFIVSVVLAIIFPLIRKERGKRMALNISKLTKAYGTDLELEMNGVWFKSSFLEGFEMLIARSGNKRHEKAMRAAYKPYTKTLRAGRDLPDDVTDTISTDLILDTILLDWRGLTDDDGNVVPYSKDVARELLEDKSLKELKKEINEFSEDAERYKSESIEETVKN